jgi:nucleoside 2-deoxyribosyltransferase
MIKYDVFLICPVRDANLEQKQKMEQYIQKLESKGKTVYYPARNTDQIDPIGYRICFDNMNAIKQSKFIHIFYDKTSQGSLFDLGMAFALGKPLTIVNLDEIEPTEGKSFANMIMRWSNQYNSNNVV